VNAKEAAKVLAEIHPSLILMDIQLPGIDGLELTRRLKAEPTTRDITIVGLTAYAMKGDEERILADARLLPVRGFHPVYAMIGIWRWSD